MNPSTQVRLEKEMASPVTVSRHYPWGHLVALRADPLTFLLRAAAAPGPLVPLRLLHRLVWLVKSPEALHHIFHHNAENYSKSNSHYRLMRLLLGDGLLTSTDALQQRRRRAIHHDLLRPNPTQFAAAVDAALSRELRALAVGTRRTYIRVDDLVARLSLNVVGDALLGTNLSPYASTIDAAVRTLNRRFGEWSIWSFLPWMPTPENRRCWQSVRVLRQIASDLLRETHHGPSGRPSLRDGLERAARASSAYPAGTEKYLIDEVVTLIVASYETTALATTWALLLLAQHTVWQDTIAAELGAAPGGAAASPPSFGSRALTLVMHETLRLYPPVWIMSRTARNTDVVAGCSIRRGEVVLVSPYVLHRLPEFWESPEEFRPTRFENVLPGGARALAYCPFGAGDRSCVGTHIAQAIARAVVGTLVRDFRFARADATPVKAAALATLYPGAEVRLVVQRRHAPTA